MSKKKLKKPVVKKKGKNTTTTKPNKPIELKVDNRMIMLFLSLSLLVTFFAYKPVLNNQFVNLDDDKYVTANPKIRSLEGKALKVILTQPHDGNFHPLTMLSLAIDYSLAKDNPKTYHLTNLFLHLLNTAFIFWLFFLIGKHFWLEKSLYFALIGSLFFGISTIHVESVAWVSERKDVLYAFFYFAALISYWIYLNTRKNKFIFLSLLLFVLSVLSKGMGVALSLSIVALDYLYGRKLLDKKVLLEKIPFFAISLIFGIVAVWAQKSKGYIHQEHTYEFWKRVIYASYGFTQYIGKLIFPYNLSAIYPYPRDLGLPDIPTHFPLFLLPTAIVAFLFFYFYKRNKHIAFAIFFFTANLIFVLQLIPVGGVIMSDRYSYVASAGFFYLLSYGIIYLWQRKEKLKIALFTVLAIYIGALSLKTYQQTQVWRDNFSLWNRVLTLYPHTPAAWYNLAVAYYDIKDYKHSIECYDEAIKYEPRYTDAIYNRGNTKFFAGDIKGALNDYNLCIKQNPNHQKALYNRSIALIQLRQYAQAEQDCNKVLEFTPNYPDALFNRGIARINLGKNDLAIQDFSRILQLNPNYYKAILFKGVAQVRKGDKKAGCQNITQASKLGVSEAAKFYKQYCLNQ